MKNFLNRRSSLLITLITILSFVFTACEGDDNPNNDNEFLRSSSPSFRLDLNLLTNARLLEVQGDLFVPPNIARGSIQGVYVRNIGNSYVAFELAEPNNPVGNCSFLEVEAGLFLIYTCGDATSKYSAIDGSIQEGEGRFPLKSFPVSLRDNILFVN